MEKTVLQTYELSLNVRPAYGTLYEEALNVLKQKHRRDGLAPLERVLMTLLKLFRKGTYEGVLQINHVRYRYGVANCLPDKPVRNDPCVQITLKLDDQALLSLPSLPETLAEALHRVRYDLYKKGIMQMAEPSNEQLLVGMVVYTAMLESRRWKNRFGLRLLKVAGD